MFFKIYMRVSMSDFYFKLGSSSSHASPGKKSSGRIEDYIESSGALSHVDKGYNK